MTDWLAALQTRRSVSARLLTGPAPDKAQIDTMLTIASRVPDHGKLAPWRFILIAGEARVTLGQQFAAIASRTQGITEPDRLAVEQERFTRAPLVIAVVSKAADHPKIPVWEQQLSAGAVGMNLLSAAAALGFGACWPMTRRRAPPSGSSPQSALPDVSISDRPARHRLTVRVPISTKLPATGRLDERF